jgi:hypothetical protein
MTFRSLIVAGLLAILCLSPAAAAPLADGDVLGPDNWQEAQGLLPDEILEHYRKGEYVNRIADLGLPGYLGTLQPSDFQEASAENRGRYALTEVGSIVEVATGKQPAYVMGLPFPDLDRDDPELATKIVWNFFYATWYNGDDHFLTELVMLGRHGVERRIGTDVRTRLFDGSPEARGRPNPQNLLMQRFARVVWPADLEGTTSLTWRFRDPDKHDALWSYVPGLRRARQVSALNRSDGFLGSDISLDDGSFFDGKPEDFDFAVIEEGERLVLMCPYSIRGEAEIVPTSDGGWRILWKEVPRIGADLPGWTGVPWAPVSAVLVRRPVWVVEAIPKDPNYLFGRLVLRFDAETFLGSFVTKYDRAGSLLMSYQASEGAYYTGDGGKNYIPAGGMAVRISENFLYDRATAILFPPRNPENPSDYRVSHPEVFTMDALIRIGK